ncbi:peptide transporter [Paenibacillus selenitireducens]|uniref:Peptide transporter n=1 Tax=Paenibacillus selenitireducens TaxID=1324314 RepID=A0A1T2XLI3_9BACL|nr:4'-phosphopantetheinyl transferase superfamily protein [Paenibacillus selenitireducens]OPA80596.1 peptide transporter [Paenibacillus selenitireducens]
MSKLFFVGITDTIDKSKFNLLQNLVSNEKQEKIKRFRFDIDKKLSLYSELLIRIIVCRNTDIKNQDIVFEKTYYGKPMLRNLSEFHFNISHTRNAIAVAISDYPIGVDIESIKNAEMDIVERFFNIDEFSYITENTSDQDKRFYEIWTKKEAYIKYIGKGLSMSLNSFSSLDHKIPSYFYNINGAEYVISVCNGTQKSELIELSELDIEEMSMPLLV